MKNNDCSLLSDEGREFYITALAKLEHLRRVLRDSVRGKSVIVSGASGWIGRNLLPQLGEAQSVRVFSRIPRSFEIEGNNYKSEILPKSAFDMSADFFFDFAFHRRDNPAKIEPNEALRENKFLLDFSRDAMSNDGIKKYIGVSSGAALMNLPGSYGLQKKEMEQIFENHARPGDRLIRLWAMTGQYYSDRENFALISFVRQALRERRIDIKARGRVYRTYSHILELLALSTQPSLRLRTLDSGGQPIEISQLAQRVNYLLASHTKAHISDPRTGDEAELDYYVPPSSDLNKLLDTLGAHPLSLEEQITLIIVEESDSVGYSN